MQAIHDYDQGMRSRLVTTLRTTLSTRQPRLARALWSGAALIALTLLAGSSVWPAARASAQTGKPVPQRLTFDGRSAPLAWDAGGILVARPGALTTDKAGVRLAVEWWRIDPAGKRSTLVSRDAPPGPAAPAPSSADEPRVYVVNPDTLRPELRLAAGDGSSARLLLGGESEYFFAPALAPGGGRFALARTPTGSETEPYSSIWLGDTNGVGPKPLIVGASSPVWSPDGAQLAFEHAGDVWRVEIGDWQRDNTSDSLQFPASDDRRPVPDDQPSNFQPLPPPASIRVYHTQGNFNFSQTTTCRPANLAVGTISVIPFEDYVSYVLPIEVAVSNPGEQLKAQALAVRTYAWGRMNPSVPYDVTDWTDTQAMCDLRADPRTTAAVNATAGQYIAYDGNLISAIYSADGGDPTRNCPFGGGCQYLKAVDDPVSFGQARSGHGGGMSQSGAYRWALWQDWDYIQILTHYYSGVSVEGQSSFGGFILPWNQGYITANRARIAGAASLGGALNVYARAQGLTATQVATNTLLTSFDLSNIPDQPDGSLVVSGAVGSTRVTTLTLGIDRAPPTGTLTAPALSLAPTVTLALSGADAGPSGFAGYGLSNNWIWEGEDRLAGGYVSGAGTVVSDGAALNGKALFAPAGASSIWFGPYTFALPLGRAYRAYFRLKTNAVTSTSQIAKLDVVADGANPIGIKRIYGTDFRSANQYQEFSVDFNYVASPSAGLEFRVDTEGALPGDLFFDRVLVATFPVTTPLITHWTLAAAWPPAQTVIAKFSDNAGNVSADVKATIAFTAPVQNYLPLVGH